MMYVLRSIHLGVLLYTRASSCTIPTMRLVRVAKPIFVDLRWRPCILNKGFNRDIKRRKWPLSTTKERAIVMRACRRWSCPLFPPYHRQIDQGRPGQVFWPPKLAFYLAVFFLLPVVLELFKFRELKKVPPVDDKLKCHRQYKMRCEWRRRRQAIKLVWWHLLHLLLIRVTYCGLSMLLAQYTDAYRWRIPVKRCPSFWWE